MLALTLFYHNARASVVAIAAGIVPFLFLPILDPLVNGGVLGLLASVSKHQGLDVPRLILTQILPHGVFELTAVCYATAVGLHLSAGTGRKAAAAWQARRARKAGQGAEPAITLAGAGTEASIEAAMREPRRRPEPRRAACASPGSSATPSARSSWSSCPSSPSPPSSRASSHRFSANQSGESALLGEACYGRIAPRCTAPALTPPARQRPAIRLFSDREFP